MTTDPHPLASNPSIPQLQREPVMRPLQIMEHKAGRHLGATTDRIPNPLPRGAMLVEEAVEGSGLVQRLVDCLVIYLDQELEHSSLTTVSHGEVLGEGVVVTTMVGLVGVAIRIRLELRTVPPALPAQALEQELHPVLAERLVAEDEIV